MDRPTLACTRFKQRSRHKVEDTNEYMLCSVSYPVEVVRTSGKQLKGRTKAVSDLQLDNSIWRPVFLFLYLSLLQQQNWVNEFDLCKIGQFLKCPI